jgi:hypothetical protein
VPTCSARAIPTYASSPVKSHDSSGRQPQMTRLSSDPRRVVPCPATGHRSSSRAAQRLAARQYAPNTTATLWPPRPKVLATAKRGYGISMTRAAAVFRERGIALRRQGLTDEQVKKPADQCAAGRSLAWIAAHSDVSHPTVAAALRRHGVQLRSKQDGARPIQAVQRGACRKRTPRDVAPSQATNRCKA